MPELTLSVTPALLTVPEVQRYLGASTPFTVYRLINKGKLPVVRVGKRLNIPRQALDEFIQRNQVRRAA
jgi:excisionase family DNA binding protein